MPHRRGMLHIWSTKKLSSCIPNWLPGCISLVACPFIKSSRHQCLQGHPLRGQTSARFRQDSAGLRRLWKVHTNRRNAACWDKVLQHRPSITSTLKCATQQSKSSRICLPAEAKCKRQRNQGSLHYTHEHCLANGGFLLSWWKKPCFNWPKCIF